MHDDGRISDRAAPPRAPRRARTLVLVLAAALAALEGGARLTLWLREGAAFDAGRIAAERASVLASAEAGTRGNDGSARKLYEEVLHPYLGYALASNGPMRRG